MLARLLADENVPAKAIAMLRGAGCDVLAVQENTSGMDDRAVLRLAVDQDRILVTYDRDYGELIFGKGDPPPPGVIYFRTYPASPQEVSDAVLALLGDPASISGVMAIVSSRGLRRRRFPQVRQ